MTVKNVEINKDYQINYFKIYLLNCICFYVHINIIKFKKEHNIEDYE